MGIGQVIGTTSLGEYRFVITKGNEEFAKRDEFVTVKESVTGKEVIGVIKEIVTSNELLPDQFGRDVRLSEILLTEGEFPVSTVNILGIETDDGLELPRHGITPGAVVELVSDKTLNRILSQPDNVAMSIGTLSARSRVEVSVSVNQLVSKHCSVLAMTGAGKSYTVGVLIEELMRKRGSVVVFDPHGEYGKMKFEDSETVVLSVEGKDRIKIETGLLRASDFSTLIPDLTDTQRDLLDEVLTLAYKFYEKYDLNVILNILSILYDLKKSSKKMKKANAVETGIFPEESLKNIVKKVGQPTIGAIMRRIGRLRGMGIFEMNGTPLKSIVARNQLTVIDLADADERVSQTIVASISRSIFEARRRYMKVVGSDEENSERKGAQLEIPTFLIYEEAHNFAPRETGESRILSRYIIRRIAREGRKFGVGICIVSQRPNKLDADVLSQCNTQVIMKIVNPSDQEYIRQSVENVTEDIVKDLPGLSRGEAIVVGSAIKLSVAVKIRKRETAVGGEDINIVEEWSKK